MQKAKPIPDGYHSVTPFICAKNASQAIEFYKQAFGAQELERHTAADGRIMHAVIKIGNSLVMLADQFCENGGKMAAQSNQTPQSIMLHLYVEDADAIFQKAVKAGATVERPLEDAFWGDRYGQIRDPFGHMWSIATHKVDLSQEEVEKGAAAFFKKAGSSLAGHSKK